MECRTLHLLKIGRRPYDMVVGEVVYFHFRSDLLNERRHVDIERLDALGRLSGDGYVRLTDRIAMPRLPIPPDRG
jgi:flavin reductase (DIM6/NTAB) family NADH-FMN oxidoreductase RutF